LAESIKVIKAVNGVIGDEENDGTCMVLAICIGDIKRFKVRWLGCLALHVQNDVIDKLD